MYGQHYNFQSFAPINHFVPVSHPVGLTDNRFLSSIKQRTYSSVWIWIDIETSGLDVTASNFGLLEIAAIVTDNDFTVIDTLHLIINQPESVINASSNWCKERFCSRQYGGNDLFDLCKISTVTQQNAGELLSQFIEKHAVFRNKVSDPRTLVYNEKLNNVEQAANIEQPGRCYRVMLAGSSIYFDRHVLLTLFPNMTSLIGHKTIDTTSLLETVRRLKPDALQFLGPIKNSHRAMIDILESIALMRWFSRDVLG